MGTFHKQRLSDAVTNLNKRSETQVCEGGNVLQTRLGEKTERIEYLKKRIDWLESQLERQVIRLANKQRFRMKRVLPKPLGWLKRIFGREQSEVAG